MALYRVLERSLLNAGHSKESRVYEVGEIIDYLGVAGETLEAIGERPHNLEISKFSVADGEGLHRHKRAEIFATAGRVCK